MKKVILASNPYRDRDFKTVRKAMEILTECGVDVRLCLPFDVDKTFSLPSDLRFSRLEREMDSAELLICFGGDGTILHMAKTATRRNLPILGVNIGTMGFMAELESTELELLKKLATDDYTVDSRMMMDVTVHRGRDILFHDIGLNDAVITKGAIARVVQLSVKCDDIQVMECSGDGIIVSTPTGSTAYNLSAGGPIVEPDAHGMLITPICSHDVASRTIFVSDKRVITVALSKNAKRNSYLSVDGCKAFRMNQEDVVTIKKSNFSTRLVRLKDRSFFDVVNAKFKIG